MTSGSRARSRPVAAALAALLLVPSYASAQAPPPPPPGAAPAPPPAMPPVAAGPSAPDLAAAAPVPSPVAESTPLRLSFVNGDVSFWRPGAEDWAPARENMPLAPGDQLYSGPGGNLEVQIGPKAFLRATDGAQVGIDNQEPGFLQVRLTAGTLALDVRELPAGSTVEVDTPASALTIAQAGLYRVDVSEDATALRAYRGGAAVVTPAGGPAAPIAADHQAVVAASNPAVVAVGPAPSPSAWDRWNQDRGDYLVQYGETRYVSSAVYGVDSLARHGTWRTVETYGPVWMPATVPAGWSPYSTGRWIWDPRFGWTWLDDQPWGWAPYHYGRWVYVANRWGWAPGPVIARPVYAPALVVFLGGGARPVCWAPLGWGEPVIPWWGRRGVVGIPSWSGWGGPRVVNNVVVTRQTTIAVTNISLYRNVTVTNAVVGVSAGRFGHGAVPIARISGAEVRDLRPVRGAPETRPVPASLVPSNGPAPRPPAAPREKPVVATRPPFDQSPTLRSQGIAPGAPPPQARIVPPPGHSAPGQGQHPEGNPPAPPQQRGGTPRSQGQGHGTPPPPQGQRPAGPPPQRAAPPSAPSGVGPQAPPPAASRQREAPPATSSVPPMDAGPRRGQSSTPPPEARGDRAPGPGRGGPQERGDWSGRGNQGDRNDRR